MKINKNTLVIIIILIAVAVSVVLLYRYFSAKESIFFTDQVTEEMPPSITPGFKTYRNTEFGFEFQYPENWSFHANTFGGPFTKFNLVGAPFGVEYQLVNPILINIVTPDFADSAVISRQRMGVVESDFVVGKIQGKRYESTEPAPKISIDLPLDGSRMILAAYKEYEDVFSQILASFKFLPTSILKLYRNEEWGFEFEYPQNLILKENTFRSYYSKFNLELFTPIGEKRDTSFLINIVLPEFAERSFRGLEKITSEIIVAEVQGIKYEYEYQGFPHTTVILPFGELRIILGTGEGSKQYLNEYNQILSSFKFLK